MRFAMPSEDEHDDSSNPRLGERRMRMLMAGSELPEEVPPVDVGGEAAVYRYGGRRRSSGGSESGVGECEEEGEEGREICGDGGVVVTTSVAGLLIGGYFGEVYWFCDLDLILIDGFFFDTGSSESAAISST